MNTCARLESTSATGRIHLSEETARLLERMGKAGWLQKREDKVAAKGKGTLNTYWLNLKLDHHHHSSGSSDRSASAPSDGVEEVSASRGGTEKGLNAKPLSQDSLNRLVEWNVELLLPMIRQIIVRRESKASRVARRTSVYESKELLKQSIPLDEVKEIITLPELDHDAALKEKNPDDVQLPDEIVGQLRSLVMCVATLYRNNFFHNLYVRNLVLLHLLKDAC